MKMELRHLKYFVKIAETLNFLEAAKSLFITQSTLSQQIRQLEQEMDAQLFERNNHNVRMTEAGEELLPYARQPCALAMAIPIGTPPNAIALKYLNDPEGLNLNLGFGEWMMFMLPFTILILIMGVIGWVLGYGMLILLGTIGFFG